jgi:hypothetical protein
MRLSCSGRPLPGVQSGACRSRARATRGLRGREADQGIQSPVRAGTALSMTRCRRMAGGLPSCAMLPPSSREAGPRRDRSENLQLEAPVGAPTQEGGRGGMSTGRSGDVPGAAISWRMLIFSPERRVLGTILSEQRTSWKRRSLVFWAPLLRSERSRQLTPHLLQPRVMFYEPTPMPTC